MRDMKLLIFNASSEKDSFKMQFDKGVKKSVMLLKNCATISQVRDEVHKREPKIGEKL